MADLTITEDNVLAAAGATHDDIVFGATVNRGNVLYKDTADNDEWKPASAASGATVEQAGKDGLAIAVNEGGDGQPGRIHLTGDINVGATLVAGERYYLSRNGGGAIMPEADLTTGDRVTFLGIATTTSNLRWKPLVSGQTDPA